MAKAQAKCIYTKAFVVEGPPDVIRVGATITVITKAGKAKTETIVAVSAPFETPHGFTMVRGFMAPKGAATAAAA